MRFIVLALVASLVVPTAAVAITLQHSQVTLPLGAQTVDVTIKRDAYGVPHIYANDAFSLFYGNGYAMAQDRLFQIDVLRHVGRGQAAEVLGPSQLGLDVAARRDLYTEAERSQQWQGLPGEYQTAFLGFAAGVNAYINETHTDPTKLSAEFYAIAHPPEQWIPEDSVAIADYLLSIFGVGAGDAELSNAQLLAQLRSTLPASEVEGAFHDLVWMYDDSSYSTIPANEGHYASTEQPLAFSEIPPLQWEVASAAADATPFGGPQCYLGTDAQSSPDVCAASFDNLAQSTVTAGMPLKWGSNAALIAPVHSRSGGALLLGGPQMAYYNPMIPYELALHGAGYEALGMGVAGAPGVIIGRAEHYSWTVTSGDGDQVDVVGERLVSGNSRQYYNGTTGAITDMDCRTELHYGVPTAIDQAPPVIATQEVCRTAEGPVFAMNEAAGWAFVRQGTARGDELNSGLMWLTLGRESTLQGFQDHMEHFRFTFNFNYADDDGNIAYFHWGGNPVRASGYDSRLPRAAGAWDWSGVRTGSQLPHIVNPSQGFTVNWNNLPEQGFSAGATRELWGSVHRAELYDLAIRDAIAASGDHKLGVTELLAIHERISTQNPFAYKIGPFVIAASENDADPQVQAAVAALRDWRDCGYCWTDDGAGPKETRKAGEDTSKYLYPGMAIYEQWRSDVQDTLMKDELGSFVNELNWDPATSSDPHAADAGRNDNKEVPLLNSYLGRNAHDWCDDVATPAIETCNGITLAALKQALGELTTQYGTSDVTQWHEPIHHIKFVGLSGGPAWLIPMVNRPSFVHLYDWGTLYAGSNLPPGTNQHWNPAAFIRFEADGTLPDAHKADQLDLYVNFQYKPAQMTPMGVESETHLTV
ncbi:MAG: penicillin acylase family protein [Candidatus Thermoplasmatota archaeon]